MTEGPAAVAESSRLLPIENSSGLYSKEDAVTPTPNSRDESEDDFVVYSNAPPLDNANEILHKLQTSPSKEKSEIRKDRHEINLDVASIDDSPHAEETQRLVEESSRRMLQSRDRVSSFQEVPLTHNDQDGVFFNGLAFCDTVDSLYRPVVVINTRAIPHKSLRTAALRHLREALEPVVSSGPFVLIFTAFSSSTLSKLPISWVLAAYKELSYPFKKNVQYVILVRPNKLLKAFVRLMKMVVKKKAHSKIKQILYMQEIESVTDGEVTLEHLSPKVINALGAEDLTYSDFSVNL